MTEVFNLATGETFIYSLPPEEAVIAAFFQSRGDWNTWNYAEKAKTLKIYRGKRCIACDDFTALLEGGEGND